MKRKSETRLDRSDATPAELAVLYRLWENERATLKQLAKWLYGGESASDIATIQKLLARLESKNFVRRDRGVWPHQFYSVITRDELIKTRLQKTADDLCDGSMATLLTSLVRSVSLNARQRKRIRKLIDDSDDD